jgi:hypothetical protein
MLIASLGWLIGQALSRVDQDLRIMYVEYTLGAADLAHISADVMRYWNTIIAPWKRTARRTSNGSRNSCPHSVREFSMQWTVMGRRAPCLTEQPQ